MIGGSVEALLALASRAFAASGDWVSIDGDTIVENRKTTIALTGMSPYQASSRRWVVRGRRRLSRMDIDKAR